jgi:hypothetical protein
VKDGIRTRDPWNHNPITNTIQVLANKRLTKKPKSNSAIYLAISPSKEPKLCQIITAWPRLPEHIKMTIKTLIETGINDSKIT